MSNLQRTKVKAHKTNYALVKKLNRDDLKVLSKSQIPQAAKQLTEADVAFLVQTLTEKEDMVRYHAFLLLQENSRQAPYTYGHWSELEAKLSDASSYQRSLGAMLLAENVRWDKENKFSRACAKYLSCCSDEKFITSRQAIQALAHVIEATNAYDEAIKQKLGFLTLAQYKESQQRLLAKDIAAILKMIAKKQENKK